jgi:hypothetical protein
MGEDGKADIIPSNHWLMANMGGSEHGFREMISSQLALMWRSKLKLPMLLSLLLASYTSDKFNTAIR